MSTGGWWAYRAVWSLPRRLGAFYLACLDKIDKELIRGCGIGAAVVVVIVVVVIFIVSLVFGLWP